MKLLFKKIIFTGFCCLLLINAFAQQRFIATVSPAQINKDEYVTLRLTVENADNIQSIAPPSLQYFKIVGGPNQESGMSDVNGHITSYVSLSYILQPRKPGQLLIEASTALIGGKKFKSNPISLLVKNAVSGNNTSGNSNSSPFAILDRDDQADQADFKDYVLHKGENIAEKVSRNMQLRLQTDKTTCYVGQPIVATYKLYTRLKSESKLSKNPSFNGFSVIDMQQSDATDYARESIGGREYNVYTIRKAQLYPLQPGEVELETAELDNAIQFLKDDGANGPAAARNLLSGLTVNPDALVTQSVSLSSKPLTITVKPLPEEGKPASFKGAVGNFAIEAALVKDHFSTDETGLLAIRISGSGNLQLVTAPDILWPDGIDAFDPKLTDNVSKATVPVSGDKTFTFSFSVSKEGSYTLPAVQFSYFDPQSGKYKTDSTKPISFSVSKGTGKPVYNNTGNVHNEQNISLLNQAFHHRGWIIAIVSLVIFSGLFFWLRKENRKEKEAEKLAAAAKAREAMENVLQASALNQKNPLEETQACLYIEDCVDFYALLNKEMKQFIAHKFNLDIQQLNSKNIAAAMDHSGIANETVLQLQQLMQAIEWQLYTPFVQNEKRNEMYNKSHDVIQEINTQFNS